MPKLKRDNRRELRFLLAAITIVVLVFAYSAVTRQPYVPLLNTHRQPIDGDNLSCLTLLAKYGFSGRPEFSKEGHYLAITNRSGIQGIDTRNGEKLPFLQQTGRFALPTEYVNSLVSPDGRFVLASSSDANMRDFEKDTRLWEAATGSIITTLENASVWSAAFSPDSEQLIYTHFGDLFNLVIFTIKSGERQVISDIPGVQPSVNPVHQDWILFADRRSINFNTTGKNLLTGEGYTIPDSSFSRFSSDGSRIYVWGETTAIRVHDALTGGFLFSLVDNDEVVRVALSHDERLLAAAQYNTGDVTLWDINTQKKLAVLAGDAFSEYEWVENMTFNRDGSLLVANSTLGHMQVWDTLSGKVVRTFSTTNRDFSGTAFSPDGTLLVVSGDITQLWGCPAAP